MRCSSRRSPAETIIPSRSALIVRLSSLGDVILSNHIPRALKEGISGLTITYLTKSRYIPVVKYNPYIDRLIGLKEEELTFRGTLRFLLELRKSEFDYCIDLHGNLRARLISALMRKKRSLRVRKEGLRRRALVLRLFRKNYRREHAAHGYMKAVAPILGRIPELNPQVYVGDREMSQARSILGGRERSGKPIVGICPGARWRAKMWSEKKFGELVYLITRELSGTALVFLDEGGDVTPLGMGLEREGENIVIFRGPIGVVAGLLSFCDGVVTNDSGLMHLSSALGKRVVAIFGPTTPELGFSPLGDGHRIITRGLPCQPCSLHGEKDCRFGTLECLESVTIREVFVALKSVLNSS